MYTLEEWDERAETLLRIFYKNSKINAEDFLLFKILWEAHPERPDHKKYSMYQKFKMWVFHDFVESMLRSSPNKNKTLFNNMEP